MAVLLIALTLSAGVMAAPEPSSPPDFGPNVIIFDPSMPTAEIQATADAIYAQQVNDEMGPNRYALLFMPGTYGTDAAPLHIKVGYYTEVAGLGELPTDVVIIGHVDVYNRCLAPDNCIALVNFWRSLSNLTIQVDGTGLDGCRASGNFWAVSQASPMRRVKVTDHLTLMDYCTAGPQYASGGFIADSETAFITNGSQQQFMVRNSNIGGWSNGVWNQVFSGVVGAPATSFPNPTYTTLATSPVTREKPFLYVDDNGDFNVFVPATHFDSSDTSWGDGPAAGTSIPLSAFFIAKPTDSAKTINNALARGKHLIFTPGVYNLDRTIDVKKARTVVLGMGLATLTPVDGNIVLRVANVKSVTLAGFMIDAGPMVSPTLLQVGTRRGPNAKPQDHWSDPNYPTLLSDIFFRIGGPHVGKAQTSLLVNSANVVLDHIWAWRADHGNGVGWTVNKADTGVVVNGDNVTAYGMFVEHYQKTELIWNGENGKTIMFQNEMPYDPPSQEAWQNNGVNGYPAYKVGDNVKTHEAWGLGSYSFFNVGPDIHAERAFEVPVTPGVTMHSLVTIFLNANGGIDHVINDTGEAVNSSNQDAYIVTYP
jgi:hypothetical protein